jgi:hypothetical protein
VVFDAWLRILTRTPRSIMWLLRFPAIAEQNILRCAQQWAGADIASRIRFTDVAPKEAHVRRCRVADLFLDTIECNAHTVATEFVFQLYMLRHLLNTKLQCPVGRDSDRYMAKIRVQDVLQGRCQHRQRDWLWTTYDRVKPERLREPGHRLGAERIFHCCV